jgi:hypothetical protein
LPGDSLEGPLDDERIERAFSFEAAMSPLSPQPDRWRRRGDTMPERTAPARGNSSDRMLGPMPIDAIEPKRILWRILFADQDRSKFPRRVPQALALRCDLSPRANAAFTA